MKTIKQIADELGVNKQKVYRFIVKNHITASSEVKQSKLYDEAAERLIKSHFDRITTSCERSSEPHQKSGNEMLLEQLIKELEVKNEQLSEKDRQIREKDRQIAEMQAQLSKNQKLIDQEQAPMEQYRPTRLKGAVQYAEPGTGLACSGKGKDL